MAAVALGLLLCVVSLTAAAPGKVYDQRQQGELNIHAQLGNIVILLFPSSKINLMEMSPASENDVVHVTPDSDFLNFLQSQSGDRYEVPATSQQVQLTPEKEKDKEEEVVATVEEMKPDKEVTEQTTPPVKLEATENEPIKENSTVSELLKNVVFKVSIPVELKDSVKKALEAEKATKKKETEAESDKASEIVQKVASGDKLAVLKEKTDISTKKDQLEEKKEESTLKKKEESTLKKKEESSSQKTEQTKPEITKGSPLDDLIKPVAARRSEVIPESSTTTRPLTESARREKVIRYKAESKWAPGLLDLLGPARTRSRSLEAEERQRFAALCAPGVWDPELKTCIMPAETRSRSELARFLETMRVGIALPSQ